MNVLYLIYKQGERRNISIQKIFRIVYLTQVTHRSMTLTLAYLNNRLQLDYSPQQVVNKRWGHRTVHWKNTKEGFGFKTYFLPKIQNLKYIGIYGMNYQHNSRFENKSFFFYKKNKIQKNISLIKALKMNSLSTILSENHSEK